jgi:hypothetical protein
VSLSRRTRPTANVGVNSGTSRRRGKDDYQRQAISPDDYANKEAPAMTSPPHPPQPDPNPPAEPEDEDQPEAPEDEEAEEEPKQP